MAARKKTATWDDIFEVARSFWECEPGEPPAPATDYARGQMELLGRLRRDFFGSGEGTAENAIELAEQLNISPTFYEPRPVPLPPPAPEVAVTPRPRSLIAAREDLVTLWTTGDVGERKFANAYFWADRDVAMANAEDGGHDLLRVTLAVERVERESR